MQSCIYSLQRFTVFDSVWLDMIWSLKPTESKCKPEPAPFTAASVTGLLQHLPELPHSFAGLWSCHVLSEGESETSRMFWSCSPDVSTAPALASIASSLTLCLSEARFGTLCAPPGSWCSTRPCWLHSKLWNNIKIHGSMWMWCQVKCARSNVRLWSELMSVLMSGIWPDHMSE